MSTIDVTTSSTAVQSAYVQDKLAIAADGRTAYVLSTETAADNHRAVLCKIDRYGAVVSRNTFGFSSIDSQMSLTLCEDKPIVVTNNRVWDARFDTSVSIYDAISINGVTSNGSDVYLWGTTISDTPAYWKNGKRSILSGLSGTRLEVVGIFFQ